MTSKKKRGGLFGKLFDRRQPEPEAAPEGGEAELLEAISSGRMELVHVKKPLRTPALCEAAVKRNPMSLIAVPMDMRTEEMCREAVEAMPEVIEYVPLKLRSPEMCAKAVAARGHLLRFVPVALKTAELCAVALCGDSTAIAAVPESLRSEAQILALQKGGMKSASDTAPEAPEAGDDGAGMPAPAAEPAMDGVVDLVDRLDGEAESPASKPEEDSGAMPDAAEDASWTSSPLGGGEPQKPEDGAENSGFSPFAVPDGDPVQDGAEEDGRQDAFGQDAGGMPEDDAPPVSFAALNISVLADDPMSHGGVAVDSSEEPVQPAAEQNLLSEDGASGSLEAGGGSVSGAGSDGGLEAGAEISDPFNLGDGDSGMKPEAESGGAEEGDREPPAGGAVSGAEEKTPEQIASEIAEEKRIAQAVEAAEALQDNEPLFGAPASGTEKSAESPAFNAFPETDGAEAEEPAFGAFPQPGSAEHEEAVFSFPRTASSGRPGGGGETAMPEESLFGAPAFGTPAAEPEKDAEAPAGFERSAEPEPDGLVSGAESAGGASAEPGPAVMDEAPAEPVFLAEAEAPAKEASVFGDEPSADAASASKEDADAPAMEPVLAARAETPAQEPAFGVLAGPEGGFGAPAADGGGIVPGFGPAEEPAEEKEKLAQKEAPAAGIPCFAPGDGVDDGFAEHADGVPLEGLLGLDMDGTAGKAPAAEKEDGNMAMKAFSDIQERVWTHGIEDGLCMLSDVPAECRKGNVCIAAVKVWGRELALVPDEAKTFEMCMKAVRDDGTALEFVPERMKTPKLCMEAIKHAGGYSMSAPVYGALEFVPEALRSGELCSSAIDMASGDIVFVPEEILTEEMCVLACSDYPLMLRAVPERLRTEKVCLTAASGESCHGVWDALPAGFKNKRFCLRAFPRMGEGSRFLKDVPDAFFADPQFCGYAVKLACDMQTLLAKFPAEVFTPALCLAAVKKDGRALKHVPAAMKTPAVCMAALLQTEEAAEWLPEGFLEGPEGEARCLAAVRVHPALAARLPEAARTEAVARMAERMNPETLKK